MPGCAEARRFDLYLEFVEDCFNRPSAFPDLDILAGDSTLSVHRCILAARCPTLCELCIPHRLPDYESLL